MAHSTCLRLQVNPVHPEPRKIERAIMALEAGGVIAYPTDTTYGIGCSIFEKKGIERILQLKALPQDHLLSFICADLSDIARYALTVGIRVPNNPVTLALARAFRKPIVSTSTVLNGQTLLDADDISLHMGHGLDMIIDAGVMNAPPSSVVDLSGPYPVVIREGAGDLSWVAN